MDHRMNTTDPAPRGIALRAIAALIVVANIAFNYLYNRLGSAPRIDEISARFATTLTPAGYAFAIWGVIYTAFVVYCVQSFRRAHARDAAYDALAIPLAVANLLAAAWIFLFTHGQVGAAMLVIVATAATGGWMFLTAAREAPARQSRWLRVPFALFFGWITVAMFAGIAQWLNARGWLDADGADRLVSVCFLAAAAIAALFVARRFIEPVYPLVVAWAAGAVFVAQKNGDTVVAFVALAVAACALLTAAWAAHAAWDSGRAKQAFHA